MIAQILLADDDPDIRGFIGDYLTTKGHRMILADDGFQLAAKAAEHRPHLIITDVQMPGAYGSSAYQILQKDENTRNIPLIFISGHPYERVAPILPNDPKTRFLHKPLDLKKLEALIVELLPMGGYCP